MTAKRGYFGLICLPPDEGGLIAIGGFNGSNHIDVVESLDGEGATEWRRLASLPLPLSSTDGGLYFKQRIFVPGGVAGGGTTSAMLAFQPPTVGGPGQWVTLKVKLPHPVYPRSISLCGNSLFLISKVTFPTRSTILFNLFD